MKKKGQEAKVLEYMLANGGITSWEAIQQFGCTRLSAKIYTLRKKGWVIDSERIKRRTRYGEETTFNRYFVVCSPTGKRA